MRIGELAASAGVSAKTVRFYEDRGLIPAPARTAGGYRDYADAAVARLDFIRRGRGAGLTLAQIGEVLRIRDAGVAPCIHVDTLLTARLTDLDRQISDLRHLRRTVAELRNRVREGDPSACRPEDVCRYV